jgi:hypothetical protein
VSERSFWPVCMASLCGCNGCLVEMYWQQSCYLHALHLLAAFSTLLNHSTSWRCDLCPAGLRGRCCLMKCSRRSIQTQLHPWQRRSLHACRRVAMLGAGLLAALYYCVIGRAFAHVAGAGAVSRPGCGPPVSLVGPLPCSLPGCAGGGSGQGCGAGGLVEASGGGSLCRGLRQR